MSKMVGGREIIYDIGDSIMGQSRNRYMSAANTTWAAATNSCTWPSPGVSEITISVPTTASLTEVLVVFDSPSDGYTSSAFAGGIVTSTTVDVDVSSILPNTTRTFIFSSPIRRIDFLPIGANCKIWVEAN